MVCAVAGRVSVARAANAQWEPLARQVALQSQNLSSKLDNSPSSADLSSSQISSLIESAETYFSARDNYQKVLFDSITREDIPVYALQNAPLAEDNFTGFTSPRTERTLLSFFQKYFSADIPKLTLSQLISRRDLLRRISSFGYGQLSGYVWLYDSPFHRFAVSRLGLIDPRVIAVALASAKSQRAKHRYGDAQKIYETLLHDYDGFPQMDQIKVLLTQCIVDGYNYQFQKALAAHQFTQARGYLQQIIDQYPDTAYAAAAQKQFQQTISVAINYYQQVADDSFHPEAKIGVPQNKAADYYARMFHEDETGIKADTALYYWARALGTEGKVKQEVQLLQQHLKTFPQGKMRAPAMYLLGFTYCNHQLRDYKAGVPLLLQVAKDFPKNAEAPESLWTAAFVLGSNKQYQQAIPLLQQLKKEYPKSPRAKYADKWIAKYQGG
jgi:TolA-binding protein